MESILEELLAVVAADAFKVIAGANTVCVIGFAAGIAMILRGEKKNNHKKFCWGAVITTASIVAIVLVGMLAEMVVAYKGGYAFLSPDWFF